MQVFILFALFVASQANVLVAPAIYGTGSSAQYRSQDNMGNYAFGYNEGHGSGATFRKESGSHGVVVGSYGLSDADGRKRIVNYVADGAGFRADIKTNEPGVEPKDPAHTSINKAVVAIAPAVHYAAPAIHHAAPIHHAAAIPAPLYAGASAHHYAAAPALHYAAAPALHYAATPGALHYAGHPFGGYSYSSAIGHHSSLYL